MAFTLQKTILSLGLVAISTVATTSYAANLQKCGQGNLIVTAKNVGTASYFAEQCGRTWQNQNIQMEFAYTQNIPEWAFKRAANFLLKRNVSDQKLIKVFEPITALYKPVKAGDTYRLNYIKQSETLSLSLNNQLLGQIKSPQAQQYFNIWLGSAPFSVTLKQELLK